ncbi:unnamed protein product [Caenorhabditis sp. 36 PRJEB53466]|nr:unnamed protein product [Caenorhabditis sp. 36 PRJEB53466]
MSRFDENNVNCERNEKSSTEQESNYGQTLTENEKLAGSSEELQSPISLVISPNGSEQSNDEIIPTQTTSTLTISSPPRKPSRNLEDIDRKLAELHDLTEDAYMTAQLAQGHQAKMFDKLFETGSVYLKKCETVPGDLTKQQFSDEDGILEEIEEAVRDAEEKQFEPNHVGVVLDTECSSEDDGGYERYLALGKLDHGLRSRLNESGDSLRNIPGQQVRHRVSSNATLNDRRSMISGHERARSNDSRATSLFSSSIASFRRPISHFSIDNSCFDITEPPTQRSLMCTPVEKMFVKNSRSAPEMRVHETKISPFLPSPSPSNDATTTTSDPSVSSELSVEQPPLPAAVNLKLRLNEGLCETASPIASPVPKPRIKKEKKRELLKMSSSSPNMNSQNLLVNVLRPSEAAIENAALTPNPNRTFEVVSISISNLELVRKPKKSIYIMAKFDNKDVHRSAKLRGDNLVHEFSIETIDSFSSLHLVFLEGSKAKVARPVGKVSIAKKDLEVGTELEQTLKLCAVSKYPDFCGQICIDLRRQSGSFSIRVVDCGGGLKLKENQSLLLLVSTIGTASEVGKLAIDTEEKRSKEWLEMPCVEGMLSLKLTLWQDLLKGINAVFHGQVRVDVDENWTSGPAKWFYLRSKTNEDGEVSDEGGDIGAVTVKTTYQIDHILRMQVYKPLLDLLFSAGDVQPLTASLVAVIEALPKVELGPVSRSLVELMAQSERIRPVLNSLYVNSILKCQDENTLFRGQSLSGKMLFEILTTFGKMYLITTLKPVVDKIYKERRNCEVDPARVVAGTSLEKNSNNLLVYFQMLFERVTTSSTNCPHLIKQLLYDLRTVVGDHSSRPGVQRLAVSSFVIMRFFAAAILNPKAFEIRKDQPDLRVSRTLLLLSKLLQRLSNCSVSEGPLSSKEIWLNGVFETVTSEQHKCIMANFLDNISLVGDCEPERCTVFKFGNLQQVDRSRLAWKKVLHYKKRYVQLTETQIIWQKDVQCQPKGKINLTDVKSVTVDNKNIITIACEAMQTQFEAPGGVEANDWLTAIERQRNRTVHKIDDEPREHFFDAERHLDKIHNLLFKYRDVMLEWRDQLQQNVELDEKTAPELLKAGYVVEERRQLHKDALIATLSSTIAVTDAIQLAHEEYEKENEGKTKMEEATSDEV